MITLDYDVCTRRAVRSTHAAATVLACILQHRRAHRPALACVVIHRGRTAPRSAESTRAGATPPGSSSLIVRCSTEARDRERPVNHQRRALVHRRLEPRGAARDAALRAWANQFASHSAVLRPLLGVTAPEPAALPDPRVAPAGDDIVAPFDRYARYDRYALPVARPAPGVVVAQVPAPEPVPAPAVRPVPPAGRRTRTQNSNPLTRGAYTEIGPAIVPRESARRTCRRSGR